MKASHAQLIATPQFDSGRWKLRLERVPVDPDNETTMGMDSDSGVQARINETNETYSFSLPIEPGKLGDFTVRFRFDRTGQTQFALKIAREISNFLKYRSSNA